MNRKKVAWMLVAVLMVASVDGSAVMASGAEFSTGVADVAGDSASELVDVDGESEAGQDIGFEDGSDGLSDGSAELDVSDGSAESEAARAVEDRIDVSKCSIKAPYRTTQISEYDAVDYTGLEVTIGRELSGTTTYKYNSDRFKKNVVLEDNFEKDDNGLVKPGEYTVVVKCEGEEIGTVPITVLSMADYMEKYAVELPVGTEASVKLGAKGIAAYYTVAPETGYYKVDWPSGANLGAKYYDTDSGDGFRRWTKWIKREKGEKFYTIVKNYSDRDVETQVGVTSQTSILKKLTIKSEPEKKSFVRGIDYPLDSLYPIKMGEEDLKGLVVTLEYEDGTTEDLKYGDKSRYGDALSVELTEGALLKVSVSGIYSAGMPRAYISVEDLRLEQYFRYKGESLEVFPEDEMRSVVLNGWRCQVYSFVPKKTAEYTFYSTGSTDTYGSIMFDNSTVVGSNDNGGEGLNFKITKKLRAGERYYLCVHTSGVNYKDGGECKIRITNQGTSAEQTDLTKAAVSGIDKTYIYTGKAITPVPTVTFNGKALKAGTDYSVTYSGNIKSGTATVKITGKGAYTGEKTVTFQIINKITYRLNGGKQNKRNKTTFYKETVKLYAPTRKGYIFGGWYKGKTFETKMTSISKSTVKNVTLYAKWIKAAK